MASFERIKQGDWNVTFPATPRLRNHPMNDLLGVATTQIIICRVGTLRTNRTPELRAARRNPPVNSDDYGTLGPASTSRIALDRFLPSPQSSCRRRRRMPNRLDGRHLGSREGTDERPTTSYLLPL
jgi:hypothetical protein